MSDLSTLLADLKEQEALDLVKKTLDEGGDPMAILADAREGMKIVGERFGNETYFIPEKPTLEYENRLWEEGFRVVAGLDEAGRGAWAGPVFAAAVVLPTDNRVLNLLNGVRDSKCMTPNQRERWRGCIQSASVAWTIGSASHLEIDRLILDDPSHHSQL